MVMCMLKSTSETQDEDSMLMCLSNSQDVDSMSMCHLCFPNEDFGRRNKRWYPDFRLTFQWLVAQIEYSRPWKVLRTSGCHLLFLLPKSSFGRVQLMLKERACARPASMVMCMWKSTLCSPNEDFGRPNKHFRTHFRSTFQRFVAQIEYSRPGKVLRKLVLKCLFGLPKSSFGRGKLQSHKMKIACWCVYPALCSSNEDFEQPKQHFIMRFRSTFQRSVAQIEW